MTWDENYHAWSEVRRKPGQEAHRRMQAARKRVAENTPDDWLWLRKALADPGRKWFVAGVFKFRSVPKRLFDAMLRAGVLERNPSLNRVFIEPCVRSLGGWRVLEQLLRLTAVRIDGKQAQRPNYNRRGESSTGRCEQMGKHELIMRLAARRAKPFGLGMISDAAQTETPQRREIPTRSVSE